MIYTNSSKERKYIVYGSFYTFGHIILDTLCRKGCCYQIGFLALMINTARTISTSFSVCSICACHSPGGKKWRYRFGWEQFVEHVNCARCNRTLALPRQASYMPNILPVVFIQALQKVTNIMGGKLGSD